MPFVEGGPDKKEKMHSEKLIGDEALLEALFDEGIRPTKWWLRDQRKARKIPFIKIGRVILYDPTAVRKALNDRFSVREMSTVGASK
jgi:hypothetical protein